MLIKVCGLSDPQSICGISRLQPSLIGFIFYPPSPRNACSLSPAIVKSIPDGIERAGVFVNSCIRQILDTAERYSLTAVQLHGEESPEMCSQLRLSNLKVIKAIGVNESLDNKYLGEFEGAVDMFVFDTATAGYGGSGRKFDWTKLKDYSLSTPFLLSGGIGPEDAEAVHRAAAVLHRMAGVDINSRFEINPGNKSIELVKAFMEAM